MTSSSSSPSTSPAPLLRLPDPLLFYIADFCPVADALVLGSSVCRRLFLLFMALHPVSHRSQREEREERSGDMREESGEDGMAELQETDFRGYYYWISRYTDWVLSRSLLQVCGSSPESGVARLPTLNAKNNNGNNSGSSAEGKGADANSALQPSCIRLDLGRLPPAGGGAAAATAAAAAASFEIPLVTLVRGPRLRERLRGGMRWLLHYACTTALEHHHHHHHLHGSQGLGRERKKDGGRKGNGQSLSDASLAQYSQAGMCRRALHAMERQEEESNNNDYDEDSDNDCENGGNRHVRRRVRHLSLWNQFPGTLTTHAKTNGGSVASGASVKGCDQPLEVLYFAPYTHEKRSGTAEEVRTTLEKVAACAQAGWLWALGQPFTCIGGGNHSNNNNNNSNSSAAAAIGRAGGHVHFLLNEGDAPFVTPLRLESTTRAAAPSTPEQQRGVGGGTGNSAGGGGGVGSAHTTGRNGGEGVMNTDGEVSVSAAASAAHVLRAADISQLEISTVREFRGDDGARLFAGVDPLYRFYVLMTPAERAECYRLSLVPSAMRNNNGSGGGNGGTGGNTHTGDFYMDMGAGIFFPIRSSHELASLWRRGAFSRAADGNAGSVNNNTVNNSSSSSSSDDDVTNRHHRHHRRRQQQRQRLPFRPRVGEAGYMPDGSENGDDDNDSSDSRRHNNHSSSSSSETDEAEEVEFNGDYRCSDEQAREGIRAELAAVRRVWAGRLKALEAERRAEEREMRGVESGCIHTPTGVAAGAATPAYTEEVSAVIHAFSRGDDERSGGSDSELYSNPSADEGWEQREEEEEEAGEHFGEENGEEETRPRGGAAAALHGGQSGGDGAPFLFPLVHMQAYFFLLQHATVVQLRRHVWQPAEWKYAVVAKMVGPSGDAIETRFFYSYYNGSYPKTLINMTFTKSCQPYNYYLDKLDASPGDGGGGKNGRNDDDEADNSDGEKGGKHNRSASADEVCSLSFRDEGEIGAAEADATAASQPPRRAAGVSTPVSAYLRASRKTHRAYHNPNNARTATRAAQSRYKHARRHEVTLPMMDYPYSQLKRRQQEGQGGGPTSGAVGSGSESESDSESWSDSSDDDGDGTVGRTQNGREESDREEQNTATAAEEGEVTRRNRRHRHRRRDTPAACEPRTETLFTVSYGRVELDSPPQLHAPGLLLCRAALGLPESFPVALLWNALLTAGTAGLAAAALHHHLPALFYEYGNNNNNFARGNNGTGGNGGGNHADGRREVAPNLSFSPAEQLIQRFGVRECLGVMAEDLARGQRRRRRRRERERRRREREEREREAAESRLNNSNNSNNNTNDDAAVVNPFSNSTEAPLPRISLEYALVPSYRPPHPPTSSSSDSSDSSSDSSDAAAGGASSLDTSTFSDDYNNNYNNYRGGSSSSSMSSDDDDGGDFSTPSAGVSD